MHIISFEDADPLLSWPEVANAIEKGHDFPKAEIGDLLLQNAPNALLTRGAWIDGMGMAIKSMSVFPGNQSKPSIQGAVLIFDNKNGEPTAIIDGILVTKWKTAGDSVLGARLLANPNPKTHLMVGAGTVASSIIDAYKAVFPTIEKFVLWNRNPQKAETLARAKSGLDAEIEIAQDLASACKAADIITSATMTKEPILSGDWVQPGTHVDLIGAFKPDMREADDALLQKSELFVDSRETTIGHIGEIEIPLQSGAISSDDILGDLYDIRQGIAGRSGPDSVTIFKNGGGAHLDLMTSNLIVDTIRRAKL